MAGCAAARPQTRSRRIAPPRCRARRLHGQRGEAEPATPALRIAESIEGQIWRPPGQRSPALLCRLAAAKAHSANGQDYCGMLFCRPPSNFARYRSHLRPNECTCLNHFSRRSNVCFYFFLFNAYSFNLEARGFISFHVNMT